MSDKKNNYFIEWFLTLFLFLMGFSFIFEDEVNKYIWGIKIDFGEYDKYIGIFFLIMSFYFSFLLFSSRKKNDKGD